MQTDFFKLHGAPARMLELLDEMHSSDAHRWIPRRLILQNYWLFDEPEVFYFARGNLMLTGRNESGKSTVLITVITMVLDMVLTPDRIDTMGSGDKSVRYYLIGKDDATPESRYYHRERTSYAALEFELGNTGQFVTIGLGLRCSRDWANKRVDRWGWVLRDGRRVELDLELHDGGTPKRSLREHELRERLGDGGRVFDRQEDYWNAVNDALYGFETLEEFERMLEILHVVRTPKLGEGLNIRKVEELLKRSLPPIRTRAIESASEIFARLDTIETEITRLNEQIEVSEALEGVQDEVVLAEAREAALAYRQAAREHRSRLSALDRVRAELERARASIQELGGEREELSHQLAAITGRLEVLEDERLNHGALNLQRELDKAEEEHARTRAQHEALRRDAAEEQKGIDGARGELDDITGFWERQKERFQERLQTISGAAGRALWTTLQARSEDAGYALNHLTVRDEEVIGSDLALSAIGPEAAERRVAIGGVLSTLREFEAAERGHESVIQASIQARAEYNRADERYRLRLEEAEEARQMARQDLERWRAGCQELEIPEETLLEVVRELRSYSAQGHQPVEVLVPMQAHVEEARAALRAEQVELAARRSDLQRARQQTSQLLNRLREQPDIEPERSPEQVRARRFLLEAGIAHAPLFAVCDLAPALQEDPALAARVEGALAETGILDALVLPVAEHKRVRALLEEHGLGDRWIAPISRESSAPAEAWLRPVAAGGLSEADVQSALDALDLTNAGTGVAISTGSWRLGPLHGTRTPAPEASVHFIGETNRREERARRIAEAQAELERIRTGLSEVEDALAHVQSREQTLTREWEEARRLRSLQQLHDTLRLVSRDEEERERRREQADEAAQAVETAGRGVQEKRSAHERATDAASFLKGRSRGELESIDRALEEVARLASEAVQDIEQLDHVRRQYAQRARDLQERHRRLDELMPRVSQALDHLHTAEARLQHLRETYQRESRGLQDIVEEQRELSQRRRQLEKRMQEAQIGIAKLEERIDSLQPQETDYADQARSTELSLQAAESTLRKRLSAYRTLEDLLRLAQEDGIAQAATRLLSGVDAQSVEESVQRAHGALREMFIQHRNTFVELRPTLEGSIIYFAHPDGRMRLDELHRVLEDERGIKETLLEAEDRRLIEQLMLREVVDAIREAIARTRQWVAEVNRILSGMDLFKNGIMRLVWSVKPRETTDAFDPRYLDSLLSQEGMELGEAKREELLEIFRSMVEDIRRRNRDNQLREDYKSALLGMVDYTKWYSLTVQRRDEIGRWVPLTRKLYNQGSGGRRTLDLLLPLLAAVSARLAAAQDTAPRLVGFDEAFAGVDDVNATEIYRLLAELEFCWIMATEKTTAIGPNVRGSATYEFLNDGATVVPSMSLWDGSRAHDFLDADPLAAGIGESPPTEAEPEPALVSGD